MKNHIILLVVAVAIVIAGYFLFTETEIIIPRPEYIEAYDMDDDCDIDQQDVESVEVWYGTTGAPGWVRQDVNLDGAVDITDVSLVSNSIGAVCEYTPQ